MKFTRILTPRLFALAAVLSIQHLAFADASYQETTQITGGSLVSMMKMASVFSAKAKDVDKPVVSSVMVQGNKMVRIRPDSTEIIDLDRQTITHVYPEKRAYTVMTFAQMQQAINNAATQAKQQKQQQPQSTASGSPNVQMSFHANITNNGAVKQIDGRDAKEALLTLVMDAQATDGSNQRVPWQ